MTRRVAHGFTLMEMIVVIGISGVTIGLLGVTLQTVLRATGAHQDSEAQIAMLTRLDVLYRSDVHQAVGASLAPTPGTTPPVEQLVLKQPDMTRIEYRCDGVHVHRTMFRAGQITHHDAFNLGPRAQIRFEIENGPYDRQHVSLVVETFSIHDLDMKEPYQTHQLVAVLGSESGAWSGVE